MAQEHDDSGAMIVSRNVRRLRLAAGMTQDDLAALVEMPRSHLGAIETRGINITVATLMRLATALNVDPRELLRPD